MIVAGLVACVVIVVGLIVFFFLRSPDGPGTESLQEASSPQTDTDQPASPAAYDPSEANATDPEAPGGPFAGEESNTPPGMPLLSLPEEADSYDLENLALPPMPYCIYTGAYKDFQEAATTQSELDSNYLPAYIVPVEIKGNVAQSLFGVTQDGLWYRVLTGHFSSKEEARHTLRVMMAELPGYQPEIMRFRHTVECGRFLVTEEARKLSERLDQEDVFHYTQTFPTTSGESLTRVLVGCYFSMKGAEEALGRLQGKGFSCVVSER